MKKIINSDEINPWTYRNREGQNSPAEEQTNPFHNAKIASLPLPKPLSNKPTQAKSKVLPQLTGPSIHELDLHFSKRVLRGTGEGFEQAFIQKTSASYKIISFEFGCKGWQQKKKEKHLPFNLKTLRQFTEGMTVQGRKEAAEGSEYQKALRVKRYFTEQKDYEDEEEKSIVKVEKQDNFKIEQLATINRSEQIRRKRDGQVKVVKLIKNTIPREEVIKGGRLFEQINHLCQTKGNASGHLSLMKRNYNMKKLERLLKGGESFTLRNKE